MPTLETVTGPVDVDELGLTLVHEHFRFADEALRFQFPRLYDERAEWEAAIADARAVAAHGVKTVVEPSAMFGSRDAAFSRRIAEESGLNVVLATGVYTYDHLPVALLTRNATALALLERGYADRIMLSQDYCSTIDRFPPEIADQLKASEAAKWSMTLLFDEVIPYLRANGMTEEQLDTMMVANPRAWLAWSAIAARGSDSGHAGASAGA